MENPIKIVGDKNVPGAEDFAEYAQKVTDRLNETSETWRRSIAKVDRVAFAWLAEGANIFLAEYFREKLTVAEAADRLSEQLEQAFSRAEEPAHTSRDQFVLFNESGDELDSW